MAICAVKGMDIIMYEQERIQLKEICKLLYERQLVTASDGNISMRLNEKHIIITPSRKNKGLLSPEDMIVTDLDGNVAEGRGKASSEFLMHRAIYQNRPEIGAIIHTHPVYATAFALAGKNIPDDHLIEARVILGPTALAEYGTPGTPEMAEVIAPHIRKVNSILLKNHGAITYGTDLIDAYNRMDVLEAVAKTIIVSRLLGDPEVISKENLAKLKG
ncbi:L-fuculose-phosphate aldolase [Anaerotaenia torta]|uniref:class II aldolase/adducin family protein n=1 Tax=Anaerotaenia torta TaxID=433293 RepID=UPI003D2309F2